MKMKERMEAMVRNEMFWKGLAWGLALLVGNGVFYLPFLLGCGGGGGGNPPVYDDDGVCVQNCLPDENGRDNGPGNDNRQDAKDLSTDGVTDQAEVEPYVCPSDIPPPGQYEACMPKEAKEAHCGLDETTGKNVCYNGFHSNQPCTTDAECQEVPRDKWPPCVCWEFCGFLEKKWDCGGGTSNPFTLSWDPNQPKDGLCHLIPGQAVGKPGDPIPRYPLIGEMKEGYSLDEDGTLHLLPGLNTCPLIE